MVSKIYSASESTLLLSLEKLHKDFLADCGSADFLFFAIHPDFGVESVNESIKKTFNTEEFLAFHAVDSFANGAVVEKGVALCSIKFEKQGKIKHFYIEDIEANGSLEKSAEYLNANPNEFHIFIAGVCGGKIAPFIESLSDELTYKKGNNIVGGVSSGDLTTDELLTYQFIDGKVIKNGFAIISFENVEYSTGVSFGFQPYGISYEITKAEGTKLYSIDDGKSASYMATKMLENVSDDADIRYLWYIPFALFTKERGYMNSLRTISKITDEYIEFFAPVKEGDFFKLSFATSEDLFAEDARIARTTMRQLRNPEIAFSFSCIARQYVLEEHQEREAQTYMDIFGSNLFGFFTFGEIGFDKAHKHLQFYNETSLITIMRER